MVVISFFLFKWFFFKKSDVNARKYFATKQLKWKYGPPINHNVIRILRSDVGGAQMVFVL